MLCIGCFLMWFTLEWPFWVYVLGKKNPKFMPRGGSRPSGRQKKALADKLLAGNPGKRELTVLKFQNENQTENSEPSNSKKSNNQKHKLPSFLNMVAKEGGDVLPPVSKIYKILADWIANAGCTDFVGLSLIEDFAFLRRAYLECEYMNKKMGRIASGKRSPYVNMALDYQKAMMVIYNQIWLIVSRNCEEKYENKNAFLDFHFENTDLLIL